MLSPLRRRFAALLVLLVPLTANFLSVQCADADCATGEVSCCLEICVVDWPQDPGLIVPVTLGMVPSQAAALSAPAEDATFSTPLAMEKPLPSRPRPRLSPPRAPPS